MTRKFTNLYLVQSYWDGWEDVTAADDRDEARGYLNDYRENEPDTTHRLITRRVKREGDKACPGARSGLMAVWSQTNRCG